MSCRSTPGGRAVSRATTYLTPGVSEHIPHVLHALIRHGNANLDDRQLASLDETETALLSLRLRVRAADGSPRRQLAAVKAIDDAIQGYRSGQTPLPNKATTRAWRDLPAALAAHRDVSDRPYHQQVENFTADTLAATHAIFTARPSRLTTPERHAVCEQWVRDVSAAEGTPIPAVQWENSNLSNCGGGYYRPSTHTLYMRAERPSLLTLFHEYRHAEQEKRTGSPMVSTDVEDDARAWSMSLFHQVRPRLFARLVNDGRIFNITGADLNR